MKKCSNCGHDLKEISTNIGNFIKTDPGPTWFSLTPREDSVNHEVRNSVNLSGIDVSDLVDDSSRVDGVNDATGIDSGVLETVAEDEAFQQALDQVLRE